MRNERWFTRGEIVLFAAAVAACTVRSVIKTKRDIQLRADLMEMLAKKAERERNAQNPAE